MRDLHERHWEHTMWASQLDHQLRSKWDVNCKQGDRSSCLCDKCFWCSKFASVCHGEKNRELGCCRLNVQPIGLRVICVCVCVLKGAGGRNGYGTRGLIVCKISHTSYNHPCSSHHPLPTATLPLAFLPLNSSALFLLKSFVLPPAQHSNQAEHTNTCIWMCAILLYWASSLTHITFIILLSKDWLI